MRRDVIIKNSSGGMANDPFERDASKAHILEHYDIATDPNKLIPHLSAEDGDSSSATNRIQNFAFDGTTFFGLGDNHSGLVKIYTRTDFTGASWTGQSVMPGITLRDAATPFFVYYKPTGRLYGAGYGDTQDYIWSWKTDNSAASQQDAIIGTFTNISNGLVHSKDNVLYVGIDNKIASKNGTSAWNISALTLPSNLVITQISEYGNYLAIGCRPLGAGGSRVFLWNRDSTLTTVDESIDWGPGNLMILDQHEGILVGVSFEGDTVGSATIAQTRVVFREYSGGASGAVKFDEFTGFSQSPPIQSTLFRRNYRNRILFPATIPIGTNGYSGIWSIAKDQSGRFTVALEYLYRDTGTPSTRYGLLQIGDTLFAAYAQRVAGSPVMYLDKTNDVATYTTASVRESLINPGMPEADRDLRKQLVFGGLSYGSPLTSGQQAVLKYRVDGGAWQIIFTETTAAKVVTEKIISGLIGRDFEFRDESTGGVIITGLRYKYDTLKSLI